MCLGMQILAEMVLKCTVLYGDFAVGGLDGVSLGGLAAHGSAISYTLGLNYIAAWCCSLL